MTTRNLDELRELIEHLLTQWKLHSDSGTYRQPAARRQQLWSPAWRSSA